MEKLFKLEGRQTQAVRDVLRLQKEMAGHDLVAARAAASQPAPLVVFTAGPEEEPAKSFGGCSPWSLLNTWSSHHGVDDDLALLICANTAAHVAGPNLHFEGHKYGGEIYAPTVISTAGDTRFYGAAKAAIESLYPIQRELVAKYGEPIVVTVPRKRRRAPHEIFLENMRKHTDKQYAQFSPDYKNPAKDMYPDTQLCGPVQFVLEGTLPAKPVKFLKNCHLYSVLSVAEIEELPRLDKTRYKRIGKLNMSLIGYWHRKVAIRGFMRFTCEDLEWMVKNCLYLIKKTLPVESLGECESQPLESKAPEMHEFDRLHRMVLRRVLELRFSRKDCDIDFKSEEVSQCYQKLRECYRAEACAVSHKDSTSLILPDLFVWYLLQLNKSKWLEIDEMKIAERAIAAARRLRRRVAGFHDRHYAVQRASNRLGLATKLVARMRLLARPCKLRDLARGFDNQRKDVIGPVIDMLVGLGVFSKTCKELSLCVRTNPPALQIEDFMEPLVDVPYSLLRRLDASEEYQAELRKNTIEPQD